jgi:hypothetical protein
MSASTILSMRITSKLLVLSLLLGGCPRKEEAPSAAPDAALAPLISPVRNKPFAYSRPTPRPVGRPDARVRAAPKVAPTPRRAPRDMRADTISDARAALAAAAAAKRAAVDKAVDQTISSVGARLKSCFKASTSKSMEATIRLRVHAGYVTGADVTGTNAAVRSCLDQTLRSLKFKGPAASVTSVERKIKFKQ